MYLEVSPKELLVIFQLRLHTEHQIIFMPTWPLPRTLCSHFCALTARDIADMLRLQRGRLDPELLLTSVREAQGFERGLAQMFPGEDGGEEFKVSGAFEGHMGLFIRLQEEELECFLRRLPTKLEAGDFDSGHLFASAPRFFLLIRDALQDIGALGSVPLIRDLLTLFNTAMGKFSAYLQNLIPKRLDMGKKLRPQEIKLVCTLLCTAGYCIETSGQLTAQLENSETESHVLSGAVQLFHVLASRCRSQLSRNLALVLDPAFEEMAAGLRASWNVQHQVGDQSAYIGMVLSGLEGILGQVRKYVSRPGMLQSVIEELGQIIIERFRRTITECKPISATGAQQLWVDLDGLQDGLATLTRFRGRRPSTDSSNDDDILAKELDILEKTVKTLNLPTNPPRIFVQSYLHLSPFPSPSAFHALLDLRSLSPSERSALLPYDYFLNPDNLLLRWVHFS